MLLEVEDLNVYYGAIHALQGISFGLDQGEIVTLMELIHFIRDRFDLTILLIEHQMRVVMGICEHITVMDFGEVIARGTPREIQDNPRCIEAYLGKGAASAA